MRGFFTRLVRYLKHHFDPKHAKMIDIGFLDAYQKGVDHRWRSRYGFWVVRNARGLFVIAQGDPEPWAWPLVRVFVMCDNDGRLWVDLNRKFQFERDEWHQVGSFVPLQEAGVVAFETVPEER